MNISTNITGLSHQMELWAETTHDSTIALISALGMGKTTALLVKMVLLSLQNIGLNGMLVVPIFSHINTVIIPTLDFIMSSMFPGLKYKHNESKHTITFPQLNTTIFLYSAETPDRLKGTNVAFALGDEPGVWDALSFSNMRSRVRDPRATLRQVVVTGSPEGLNYFSDLFSNPNPPLKTIWGREWHANMAHYPKLLEETYSYSPALLDSYRYGKFVPLHEGVVYNNFDLGFHVQETGLKRGLDICFALDFNVRPISAVVLQHDYSKAWTIDSIEIFNSTSEELANEIIKRYPPSCIDSRTAVLYGDASGQADSTRSTKSDYNIISEILRFNHYEVKIRVPAANPSVTERVNSVNKILSENKLTISPKASPLIKSLQKTTWKPGTSNIFKPANDTWTHPSDALGYFVMQVFPIQARNTIHTGGLNPRQSGDLY